MSATSKNKGSTSRATASVPRPKIFEGLDDDEGSGNALFSGDEFFWDDGIFASKNYSALGHRLAGTGDLFRSPSYAGGLILMLPQGKHNAITQGADLLPAIVDRVDVLVVKDGKIKRSKIPTADLNAMLKAEVFLRQFIAVDHITATPCYLPGFSITKPGFNDGGPGQRILFVGEEPVISNNLDTIKAFLDVMAFETPADRTNTVAAALTILFRNHWPGAKPIMLVTATKSHAGKDTLIQFATGLQKSVSISYQATDWAVERNFVAAIKLNPTNAVVVIENARLQGNGGRIASAFIERFATDPEPQLFSTGTGSAIRVRNNYVVAISTNFGLVSEDTMNRSLPIHLCPLGNVADRKSPIGNPKLEFLPTHQEQIASELYGMVEKWKAAGRPLDEDVRHPFSTWAETVGGILRVNGFTDFLANYAVRITAEDPVKRGLAILGAKRPDEWLPSADWAKLVVDLGLTKAIIASGDRDSDAGRVRGIGSVLSAHEGEVLVFADEGSHLVLRLEKKRGRFGHQPHLRYRFVVVDGDERNQSFAENGK